MSDVSSVDTGLPEAVVDTELPAVETEANDDAGEAEGTEPKQSGAFDDPKVKTALRNRDRKLSKARERIRELEGYTAEMRRQSEAKLAELKAPDEKDFSNYGDLVEAKAVHAAEKKIMAAQTASQTEALTQQRNEAFAQRNAEINEIEGEYAQVVTDYQQTIAPATQIIDSMPSHVKDFLRDLDNPAAAVYVLAKTGRLQDLAYMNPQFAAVTLMQAQERGEGFFHHQREQSLAKKSNAPEPMRGAKGTGNSTGKPISAMSAKELSKWLET
jgi:hypothetical protein